MRSTQDWCCYCEYFNGRGDLSAPGVFRGECRRRSPSTDGWPIVSEEIEGWCGDFVREPEPDIPDPS